MVLAEASGVVSPEGSPNGEIIITVVPEPTILALAGLSGLGLLLFRRQLGWPAAAPNGGFATRLGNSGVSEGPPSVSVKPLYRQDQSGDQ
jgi:hypothetical protein